jgi:hypothetical protein
MLQMASSAWSGIVAALKQGDIGAAWGIFVAAARAAFAQVMIIIGPFVDDAIDLLSMIGTALSDSFFAAYEAISPLISAIGSALADAFNAAADAGSVSASAGLATLPRRQVTGSTTPFRQATSCKPGQRRRPPSER